MIENDIKLLEHCVLDLQHRVQALENKIKQTQRRIIVLECKADRKTEPQTEEWHDDCNTCRWHDGACTIPCCDYEPKTEPQTDCSWK